MNLCFEVVAPRLDAPESLDLFFQVLALAPLNYQELHISFQNVGWITPVGTLALTLITRQWCIEDKVVVLKDASSEILSYLERINFFKTFPGRILLSTFCKPFEQLNRAFRSNNLLEITPLPHAPFLNAQMQALLLSRAEAVLMNSFAEKAKSVEKVLTMIAEIAGNIAHSQDEGYCVMQTYERHGRARIHIAIGDLGIGIRGSLSQIDNPTLETDLNFIQYALKSGTTSKMETRGLGLAGVYESIKELRGMFLIRSGTASVQLQGNIYRTAENLHPVLGTQVELIVRE